MLVPYLHRRRRAMQRQVFLGDHHFTRGAGVHQRLPLFVVLAATAATGGAASLPTGASQSWCFLSLPVTTSKNAFCIFIVTGPHLPEPMTRLSSSRIGVTSAAVPVKNASSAM